MSQQPSLYARYATGLADGAYLAATREVDAAGLPYGPWRIAEGGRAHDIAAAGQLAAHVLRLHAAAALDADEAAPWMRELARAGGAIAAESDVDRRAVAAMAIRRACAAGPVGDLEAEPARMVARWLYPEAPEAAAGHLCRHVVTHIDRYDHLLAPAWYAVHGTDLLAELAGRQPAVESAGGRPSSTASEPRALLRIAVRGVAAARLMPKARLAELAGVSRPTLDSWLSKE